MDKAYTRLLNYEKEYFALQDKMTNFIPFTVEDWERYRRLKYNLKFLYEELKNYWQTKQSML